MDWVKIDGTMRAQMMAEFQPPLSPASFALMMQKRVKEGKLSFSNKEDLKLVLEMYSGGFIKVFEVYQKCNPSATLATYSGHGWEEEVLGQVARL